MEKPTLVKREEFSQALIKLINESGLPPVITQPIVDSVNGELKAILQQQYRKEKQEYEATLKKEESGE